MPTPTHYVAVDAGGAGIGTESNPFTLPQALALAQQGWRVRCGPGDYIGAGLIGRASPVFSIATNGTQANPIIFFAQNYASLNTSGRSVLRHTGTTQGQGCPVLGLRSGHHWYGFYIDEQQAFTYPDTGPVIVTGSYNSIRYFRVKRATTPWPVADNNHAAIRVEGFQENIPALHNHISDCWIEDFSGIGWPGSDGGIHAMSVNNTNNILYDLVVENNYFDNVSGCLTIKGAGPARPVYGGIVFRRNLSRASSIDGAGHLFLMDMGSSQGRNLIYQNVWVGGTYGVMTYNQADYPLTGLDMFNNTGINIRRPTPGDRYGLHADWKQGFLSSSNWRFHNNLAVTQGAPMSLFAYTAATAVQSRSHNTVQGGDFWCYVDGIVGEQLADWQARGSDLNSFTRNPLFQSTTWGDPNLGKLQAGSLERNSGTDLLNLLGNGVGAPINRGAYITSDMSDPIGIRPLAA